MSHYDPEREVELEKKEKSHFVNKTSTKESEKDLWQTPKSLFDSLNREFEFDLDVCASNKNKLVYYHFSEQYSALDNDWCYPVKNDIEPKPITAAFLNPPYSKTALFLERAAQQSELNNFTVVALVNANTDTQWFAQAVKSASEVRLLTGRVGFVKASGGKSNGNTKGQCLIIWRGNCKTPCQITMVDRKNLEQA